jgi:hypothetical protein
LVFQLAGLVSVIGMIYYLRHASAEKQFD